MSYNDKLSFRINSLSDYLILQFDHDFFCNWFKKNCLCLNFEKCHIISFSRVRWPVSYQYSLNDSPIDRVYFLIKHLGMYIPFNITICRALRILGFIILMLYNFFSCYYLRDLNLSLMHPILEYGTII